MEQGGLGCLQQSHQKAAGEHGTASLGDEGNCDPGKGDQITGTENVQGHLYHEHRHHSVDDAGVIIGTGGIGQTGAEDQQNGEDGKQCHQQSPLLTDGGKHNVRIGGSYLMQGTLTGALAASTAPPAHSPAMSFLDSFARG